MFYIIIIMLKSITCIIGWIDINTFNRPCKVFFKGAEGEKIVAVNKHIARPRFSI